MELDHLDALEESLGPGKDAGQLVHRPSDLRPRREVVGVAVLALDLDGLAGDDGIQDVMSRKISAGLLSGGDKCLTRELSEGEARLLDLR